MRSFIISPLSHYKLETIPAADYIVGNPPFLGTRRMRLGLGDGYVEALTKAYPHVAENADFVMFWWEKSARLLREKRIRRFGLITTNSLRQSFNRRVVQPYLDTISLLLAVPDHPWVDTAEGAAVRISMTVAAPGKLDGELLTVNDERDNPDGSADVSFHKINGLIAADLTVGANLTEAMPLQSNADLAFWGVKFYGDGFVVTKEQANALASAQEGRSIARPFVSGKDLTGAPRGLFALDCDGLTESELAKSFPATYQHLLVRVKPVRAHNPRSFKRERWWIFGENQPGMRRAVNGLTRAIFTTETAKHRFFQFFSDTLAEGTVAVIGSADAFHLGVLSSEIHVIFSLAAGGTLEDRPRYNKTRCFDPFPFPDCPEDQKARIRAIAEELDAHRKRVQAQHPNLTLTGMYNVLEALREGRPLTPKEQTIHDAGLVSILRQLHDDLDAAVFAAYGWTDLWQMQQDAKSGILQIPVGEAAKTGAGSIHG